MCCRVWSSKSLCKSGEERLGASTVLPNRGKLHVAYVQQIMHTNNYIYIHVHVIEKAWILRLSITRIDLLTCTMYSVVLI